MPGKWPAISAETESGRQALQLVADAEEIIAELAAHPDYAPQAVCALLPANRDGDDILVYLDEERASVRTTIHTLRQQIPRPKGRANLALADYIAPVGTLIDRVLRSDSRGRPGTTRCSGRG